VICPRETDSSKESSGDSESDSYQSGLVDQTDTFPPQVPDSRHKRAVIFWLKLCCQGPGIQTPNRFIIIIIMIIINLNNTMVLWLA
jgi:hypothetical protein